MDTSCRDCVFAAWEGDKQVACEFDRLQKLAANGATLITQNDEKGQYFIVSGRICNTCRQQDMLHNIPFYKWMDYVREQVVPKVAMAVYLDDDSQIEDVHRTLDSIYNQTVQPDEVVVIYNNQGKEAPFALECWFHLRSESLRWRIESIRGRPDINGNYSVASYGDAIDLTVNSKDTKSTYLVLANAGYQYPLNYIEIIDRAINEDMERFIVLEPDVDGNGLFVQIPLYKFLQGNKPIDECNNILDKIMSIARHEGSEFMIKRFEDL